MNHIKLLPIIFFFIACAEKETKKQEEKNTSLKNNEVVDAFQQLLGSAKLNGAILIYDFQKDTFYSNNFDWCKKGHLPASTFKITNSIIALETGVLENDSTLLKWDGQKRAFEIWEQDLILKDAFHFSCVPCYQEIARKIGLKKMLEYLDKLDYGNIKVDSLTIDNFWLEGESKISQFQQIDFLKRFFQSKLPISARTEKIMKRMMVEEENENYTLRAKTGWSDSFGNNGWYVGYLESLKGIYFFATNIEPKKEFDMAEFSKIRKKVTLDGLKLLEIIK